MNAFIFMYEKKGFFSYYDTMWHKNVVLKVKTDKFYDKYRRHRDITLMK